MPQKLSQIQDIYCRRAPYYDGFVRLFRLLAINVDAYRCHAVEALNISSGDTVVDIGCGTGLNFPELESAVTASGHIIGVDLTDAMLDKARLRATNAGWTNVELVQSNITDYVFPPNIKRCIVYICNNNG